MKRTIKEISFILFRGIVLFLSLLFFLNFGFGSGQGDDIIWFGTNVTTTMTISTTTTTTTIQTTISANENNPTPRGKVPATFITYEKDAWKILEQNYFEKYLDLNIEKISLDEWNFTFCKNNEDFWEDIAYLTNLTAPKIKGKCKGKDRIECVMNMSKEYLDNEDIIKILADIDDLKLNKKLPKNILKGKASFIGDFLPLEQNCSSVVVNLSDGFYKSNGLKIKWGFGSILTEFNNTKTAESLYWLNNTPLNQTRYLKLNKSDYSNASLMQLTGRKQREIRISNNIISAPLLGVGDEIYGFTSSYGSKINISSRNIPYIDRSHYFVPKSSGFQNYVYLSDEQYFAGFLQNSNSNCYSEWVYETVFVKINKSLDLTYNETIINCTNPDYNVSFALVVLSDEINDKIFLIHTKDKGAFNRQWLQVFNYSGNNISAEFNFYNGSFGSYPRSYWDSTGNMVLFDNRGSGQLYFRINVTDGVVMANKSSLSCSSNDCWFVFNNNTDQFIQFERNGSGADLGLRMRKYNISGDNITDWATLDYGSGSSYAYQVYGSYFEQNDIVHISYNFYDATTGIWQIAYMQLNFTDMSTLLSRTIISDENNETIYRVRYSREVHKFSGRTFFAVGEGLSSEGSATDGYFQHYPFNYSNLKIYTNNTLIYNHSWFNISSQIDLNQTLVNRFLDTCTVDSDGYCYLPIIFESNSMGTINYSDIALYYFDRPNATNVSISPSPTNVTNLTCIYDYVGIEPESKNWTRWYINNILNETTQEVLGEGNITSGDNVTCSKMVANAYVNASDWVNSSTLTIGDSTLPTLNGIYLSQTSAYTDQVTTIYANCSDNSGNIESGYPKVMFYDPNQQLIGNYSMTLVSAPQYHYNYTFGTAGTYSNFSFFCKDQSGNEAQNLSTQNSITFVASSRPSGTTGGGGGGAETIVVGALPKEKFKIIPRAIDEKLGDIPMPITLKGSYDDFTYYISNLQNETYTISIMIRGYTYKTTSGRDIISSELVRTEPSKSFLLPIFYFNKSFTVHSQLPPDLSGQAKAEIILSYGNFSEVLYITLDSGKEKIEWYEGLFWSGEIFSQRIYLSVFHIILLGAVIIFTIYFVREIIKPKKIYY